MFADLYYWKYSGDRDANNFLKGGMLAGPGLMVQEMGTA